MRLSTDCFWRKNEGTLQRNGGLREIILRFFSPFSGFPGLFQSQPIAFQGQAAIRPLQKKSCQKHYRRFSVRSKMCHNRRVSERMFNPPPSGRDAAIVAEPSRLCSAALQSTFAKMTARPVAGAPLSSLPSYASFARPSASLIPMSVQGETKARWIPGGWRGKPAARAATIQF